MSTTPRYSVCELTLPDASFEQDLELIKASGATGISLDEGKLREGEEQAQLEALRASGLGVASGIPASIAPLPLRPPVMYPGPEDPAERVELMCASVRRLAMFEPECIAVTTGSAEGYSKEDAWRIAAEGIREVAKLAAEHDTRLAVEVVRADGGFDASFVLTLPDLMQFIELVDAPNVGVCYDVYHLWDTPDVIKLTEEFADQIYCVQISDWREPARTLADRLLPGEGSIDLPGLFGALDRGGYDGWYDLEVFSDDGRWGTDLPDSLWKLPYPELLQRARAGFELTWESRIDLAEDSSV